MDLKFINAFNVILPGALQTFEKLEKHFGDFERAWRATEIELQKAGLTNGAIKEIGAKKSKTDPDKEWQKIEKENIATITRKNKNYPENFQNMAQPPYILYARGNFPMEEISIAMVGSRKYTSYGKEVCAKIAKELASQKITTISGLALGIDAVCHKATLEAEGRTIAVLGTGIDDKSIYPTQNFHLAKEIIDSGGAIISEFAPGTKGLAHHFPMRNRIISALSNGVVIIEASEKSGSLITANFALEQGKDIFAIPGSIFSDNSKGTHNLIKQGAKLIENANDILEEIAPQLISEKTKENKILNLSEDENKIVNLLANETAELDELIKTANMPANKFNSVLTMLEIKGIIKNQNGKIYKINS